MSDKELKEEIAKIQAFRNKVSSSREKAIDSLEKAGITDSKGELTPQYK